MGYNVKFTTREGDNCEGVREGKNLTITEVMKLIENPYVLKISIVNPERVGINGKPKKP